MALTNSERTLAAAITSLLTGRSPLPLTAIHSALGVVIDAQIKKAQEQAEKALASAANTMSAYTDTTPEGVIEDLLRARKAVGQDIMKRRIAKQSLLDGAFHEMVNEDSDERYAFDDADIETMLLNTPPDFLRRVHTAIAAHLGDPLTSSDLEPAIAKTPAGPATATGPTPAATSSDAKPKAKTKAEPEPEPEPEGEAQ